MFTHTHSRSVILSYVLLTASFREKCERVTSRYLFPSQKCLACLLLQPLHQGRGVTVAPYSCLFRTRLLSRNITPWSWQFLQFISVHWQVLQYMHVTYSTYCSSEHNYIILVCTVLYSPKSWCLYTFSRHSAFGGNDPQKKCNDPWHARKNMWR